MLLSVCAKKGIYAACLVEGGRVLKRITKRSALELEKPSAFDSLVEVMSKGASLLKSYVDEHPEVENVIIECNNSIFKKWLTAEYTENEHRDGFMALLELIDSIPVRVSYSVTAKPQATAFLNSKYIEKPKLSSFDELDFAPEEE